MYVHMYVCMYVCTCVCMYLCIYYVCNPYDCFPTSSNYNIIYNNYYNYIYNTMFVSLTRVCVVYVVKEVASFWGGSVN